MNRREVVLGGKSRSCGQWDIWEAVFGPKGSDGYPERVWCKDPTSAEGRCEYGAINPKVVEYWEKNYDITARLRREWEKGLGAKLHGKLHIFVGASDTFYLNDAVMELQDFLETTTNPPYNGSITIGTHGGRGFEHCFNGYLPDGTPAPNGITRQLYNQKFLPEFARRFVATAPPGANLEWSTY
eukprot:Sspe_Gene.24588::Locus_9764_Transcript_1_1_Confidence_1.000_Length_1249::g.24588::m.24588